jgi:nucleotide-binding universal stress UspA family protein
LRSAAWRAAADFPGVLAVVVGRGSHLADPRNSQVRILLPVSGTTACGRAMEVAVTIARVEHIGIMALYVAARHGEAATQGQRRWRPVSSAAPPHEEAILKDVVELADRYHIPVRTAIRAEAAPHVAILREIRQGGYDFVVMGVNRRPGPGLFFGKTAARVLTRAKTSVLLVSS